VRQTQRSAVPPVARLLLVAATVLAGLFIAPSPASAHSTCQYPSYSNPPGGQSDAGCVVNNHWTVTAGDNNCDGHRVYVRFYVQAVAQSFTVEDTNGCQPGIGSRDLLSPATRYTVCTEGINCTGYRTT